VDLSPYRVELRPSAAKTLGKLDPQIQLRLRGAISLLAQDPRPPSARALADRPGFRVRVGDYRIIYTIHDDVLVVAVIALGHRRQIYHR
jgi:mRNA interferase RelE/StbE